MHLFSFDRDLMSSSEVKMNRQKEKKVREKLKLTR